jgi:hypothetical protein
MAYTRDFSAPAYESEVAKSRGRVANILKVHGIRKNPAGRPDRDMGGPPQLRWNSGAPSAVCGNRELT